MTRAEAMAHVADVSGGVFDSPDAVEAFLTMPDDERTELISGLALAGKRPDPSVWPKVLAALGVAATVAADLTGIGGAIMFIKGL